MNQNIYLLQSDTTNYCTFTENYLDTEESIIGRAASQNWKPFLNFHDPIYLELRKSDTGKLNYKFDFSSSLSPFFVISDFAFEKLDDILSPRGQIIPIVTKNKAKKFYGYYPTNALSNCLNRELSTYEIYQDKLLVETPVLTKNSISDEYLFSINEDISRVFVTEKFKNRIEHSRLLGFDFSIKIETH
ncbi:hypothetical protein [Pseudomonas agarici]|uniref:hypothetical protein n=1 Tax=Pseudomonas agarici TaxID=46677 RepID=UPI0009EA739C|nr:hypothetical protein [Pseudomonas agarici]